MRPVQGHKYHLQNWADNFDIVCASDFYIGLIGSANFAGMFLGAIFMSPMSDAYGRRPTHILGLVLYFIGSVMMYFYPFYWSVTIGCFIVGVGMYG